MLSNKFALPADAHIVIPEYDPTSNNITTRGENHYIWFFSVKPLSAARQNRIVILNMTARHDARHLKEVKMTARHDGV
jgi:hypothetical protein